MDFLQEIRKRSREEWEQLGLDLWTDLRIWIQEHGEAAALIALVSGIVLVLFFKLVLILLVISVLLCFGVLYFAVPEGAGGAAGSSGRSLSAQDEVDTGKSAQSSSDSQSPGGKPQ